ncbi:hypothetical protein BsWGS_19909 [Bradybaena similaris]
MSISVGSHGSSSNTINRVMDQSVFLSRLCHADRPSRYLSPGLPFAFSPSNLPVVIKFSSLFLLMTCLKEFCQHLNSLINLQLSCLEHIMIAGNWRGRGQLEHIMIAGNWRGRGQLEHIMIAGNWRGRGQLEHTMIAEIGGEEVNWSTP